MQEEVKSANSGELQPGDIVFECPQCGKSLAIDPRAAGFVVRCPDCQTEIQVPATHSESTEETEALTTAAAEPNGLPAFEARPRTAESERLSQIRGELDLIQAALDRLVGLLGDN